MRAELCLISSFFPASPNMGIGLYNSLYFCIWFQNLYSQLYHFYHLLICLVIPFGINAILFPIQHTLTGLINFLMSSFSSWLISLSHVGVNFNFWPSLLSIFFTSNYTSRILSPKIFFSIYICCWLLYLLLIISHLQQSPN